MLETLQNEAINGRFKNTKFMCADVTSPNLDISPGSVDLIFSNWLLMYLSDKEVGSDRPSMVVLGWVVKLCSLTCSALLILGWAAG